MIIKSQKKDLKGLSLRELEEYFEERGEKKYRAGQIYRWIYKGARSFGEMSDVPANLRESLGESAEISALKIVKRVTSRFDGTVKYLFGLSDGNVIESVFMKYKFGNSICISSQAGCGMGCLFCASGKAGLERNLSAAEMIDQILSVQADTSERVSHVTVMGTGEPFDNYENLARFIRIINDERGLNIGMRNITVSTCGVIPYIKTFSNDFPQANLAVSLHAANDAQRVKLMPAAGKYKYGELIAACGDYTRKTGRRITFEYILMGGENDSDGHADELAAKLRGLLCHVNLIPMNDVAEARFAPCPRSRAEQFRERLEERRVTATIRRNAGGDINAACGQLRLSHIKN